MHLIGGFRRIILITFWLLACLSSASQAATTPITLELGAEKTFTFKNKDANGNTLAQSDVIGAIVQAMYDESNYKAASRVYSTGAIYDVQGVSISSTPSEIELSYVNGEYYTNTGNTLATRSIAKFSYVVEEKGNLMTIKLSPPSQLETIKQATPLFYSYSQFASDEKMVKDIGKIFGSISPIIKRKKEVSGDINADYDVAPITANFKRKCNSFKPINEDSFSCALDGQEVVLQVMPYKKGSKVTYKFAVSYTLNSQGEISYSAEAAKKISASLADIVND